MSPPHPQEGAACRCLPREGTKAEGTMAGATGFKRESGPCPEAPWGGGLAGMVLESWRAGSPGLREETRVKPLPSALQTLFTVHLLPSQNDLQLLLHTDGAQHLGKGSWGHPPKMREICSKGRS